MNSGHPPPRKVQVNPSADFKANSSAENWGQIFTEN